MKVARSGVMVNVLHRGRIRRRRRGRWLILVPSNPFGSQSPSGRWLARSRVW